jgi:hypothetical protein
MKFKTVPTEGISWNSFRRRKTGKLHYSFARRLFTYMCLRVFSFSGSFHIRSSEFSCGLLFSDKNTSLPVFIGFQIFSKILFKTNNGGFVLYFRFLATELPFFLSNQLLICSSPKLSVSIFDRTYLKS